MKTLKVLLQEVVSGIKAWVNSNFAQESNTVHKTGNETVNGVKTFTSVVQANGRFKYMDTAISDKNPPGADRAVDTLSHLGSDGTFWGGLKHIWFADGQSTLQLAVANHILNGSTWSQGFWAVNLSASKDFYPVNFAPSNNNAINLGAANYQWYNVYAKNYFYNGTQWGLDQANTWTNTNTFVGNIGLVTYKSNEIDRSQHTDSNYRFVTQVAQDKNGKKMGECYWGYKASTDEAVASFWVTASDGLDNDTSHRGGIYIFHNGSTGITDVHPAHLNGTNLGTSTNKWKTFNGVNPGALSLPDYDSTAKLNLTSTFPAPDSNGNIFYTPTMSGWLYLYFDVTNATTGDNIFYAEIKDSNMANANAAQVFWRLNPAQDLPVFFPVIANKQFIIQVNFTGYTLVKALLIPGIGHIPD